MREKRKNKKKGFVFIFVVMALAVILGIFFNYSMSARARKEYMTISKTSSDLEESASQALGTGIIDAHIADQMIKKNSEAVDNYMGYFLVKDIPDNSGTVTQENSIKVWETAASNVTGHIGKHNVGPWKKVIKSNSGGRYVADLDAILDGIWTFDGNSNLSSDLRVSKGGYFIKRIKNLHSGDTLFEANDIGEEVGGKYSATDDAIQKDLKNYYWDIESNRTKIPKFEITMYKNILFQTGTNKIVRSYDAVAKMELYYRPLKIDPVGTESRNPYPLQRKQTVVDTIDPVHGVAVIVTVIDELDSPTTNINSKSTAAETFQRSSAITPVVTTVANTALHNEKECTDLVPANQKSVENYSGPQKSEEVKTPATDFDKGTTDGQTLKLKSTETKSGVDEDQNPITTVTRVEEAPLVKIIEKRKISEGTQTVKVTEWEKAGKSKTCEIITTVYQGYKLVENIVETTKIGKREITTVTRTSNLTPQPSKMVSYEINHLGP